MLTGIPDLNQPPNVQASDMLRLNVAIPSALPGDPNFSIFGVIDGDLSGYPISPLDGPRVRALLNQDYSRIE